MYTEVIREDPNGLNRQTWDFSIMDYHGGFTIFLNGYSQQVRPTKRHGWKVKIVDTATQRINMTYSRLDSRRRGLTEQEVPLPDDVAQEAKSKVVDSISVKKWSDR